MRILFVVLMCCLFGVGGMVTAQDVDVPEFTTAPCRAGMPTNRTVECGFLTVLEDRTDPLSGTIRLNVAIFRATTPLYDDPIVYLHGGPGRSPIDTVINSFHSYAPYTTTRDFIVFDLRGVGASEPNLGCREVRFIPDDLPQDEFLALMEDCRQRLIDEGRELSAYTTRSIVQDMDDLRRALDIEAWNLYGISYGTRVALTAMRDTPDGIRSVILDSVYPPDANLYDNRLIGTNRAFSALFDDCAGDVYCNHAYPDLEATFYALVDRLNAEPLDLPPEFAEDTMDGDRLVRLLFDLLYNTYLIPSVPHLIYQIDSGDLTELAMIRTRFFFTGYDARADTTIRELIDCNEEIPFNDRDIMMGVNAPEGLRGFAEITTENGFALCDTWMTTPPDPRENEPVTSDIPTLIMTGEYDPITPPEWGEKTERNLTNATYIEYPRRGHGVSITQGCPLEHARAFLDDPFALLDQTCVDENSPFATPKIALVSFTDDQFGISGITPIGWLPGDLPGNVQRTSSLFVNLAQLTYRNYTIADSLSFLSHTYAFSPTIDPVETIEVNDLSWRVYAITLNESYNLHIALAENGDDTHVVTLTGPNTEHALNVRAILYPVLRAFTPLPI